MDQLVYISDEDIAEVYELYLVTSDNPGVLTKLNPPLVDGGDVGSFRLSPDGSQVVYVADQDTDNVHELYLVDLSDPGSSTRLNPPLVVGGDVSGSFSFILFSFIPFSFSSDGSQVAYRADQDTDEVLELYLVDLSNPGSSTKLNPPLVDGGEVYYSFAFSPVGSQVAYRADKDTDNVSELYLVDLSSPGSSTKLNPPLVDGGGVWEFSFSPDGSQVAYVGHQGTEIREELYLVDLSDPGSSTKLNAPLMDVEEIYDFAFSPDGSRVAYVNAYFSVNLYRDLCELNLVDLNTPGDPTMLNGSRSVIFSYSFVPGQTHFVF